MGKRTKHGHGAAAARSCLRRASKFILSRIGSRARAHHGKRRGQIHHGVAVMLRPLRVRRIQQRPLGARRQLAEARGEKGAQGHGARAFSPPPLLLREFFLLRGVHWVVSRRFALVARVGRAHSGLAARRRVPPRGNSAKSL